MNEDGFYYDGLFWRWDRLQAAKANKMYGYDLMPAADPENWRHDPSYHWRRTTKERKDAVGKTRSTD